MVQDSSGVVFRATDSETHLPVAVRRFFPFGPTGGGLSEDEQVAYADAVQRLSEINHPALRSIICGGCDPVDAMPYIATEWIDGQALQTFLRNRPLSEPEAITVIGQALEVCQILSEVAGVEGVWVETDPHTVVIGSGESNRPVSFWIAPLKWLGKKDGKVGLEPFIALTTSIMGWTGKQPRELPATGLGGWLKWLHGAARTASLHEARGNLAAAIGAAPPQPTKRVVRQPTKPGQAKKKKSSSKAVVWILACTTLIVMGLGGWLLVRRNAALLAEANGPLPAVVEIIKAENPPAAVATPPPVQTATVSEKPAIPAPSRSGERSAAEASRKAAEAFAAARKADEVAAAKDAERKQAAAARGGVFSPTDHDLLLGEEGKQVAVVGVLEKIGYSDNRGAMFLLFSKNAPSPEFRGAILKDDATGDLSEAKLKTLIGSKIRLSGVILVERRTKPAYRPSIKIENRNAIQVVE